MTKYCHLQIIVEINSSFNKTILQRYVHYLFFSLIHIFQEFLRINYYEYVVIFQA